MSLLLAGVSLGGYLGTRGCAAHSDRLAACLPNPPQYSVLSSYSVFVEELGESIYSPFVYVAQNDPDLLPQNYLPAIENYTDIIYTLLLTCNASSQAPALITESFTSSPGEELPPVPPPPSPFSPPCNSPTDIHGHCVESNSSARSLPCFSGQESRLVLILLAFDSVLLPKSTPSIFTPFPQRTLGVK